MKTKRTKNKSHGEAAVKERKRQINGARFPVITDAAELGAAPSWQVWIGDWTKPPILSALLELRELVEPGQRVHVISDPPYGDATHNNMMRGQTSAQAASKTPISFDPVVPARIVPLLMDVASAWIVLFGELEALGEYKAAALDVHARGWKRAGIARRVHPQPQISGDRPGQGADGLAIMHSPHTGRSVWNGGGRAGSWDLPTNRDADRFHETQKPVSIMRQLVEDFTEPGDVIVDPYGGAMTTGVAALQCGRRFVGVELQPEYARRGAIRLAAEDRGLTIGAFEAGQTSVLELLSGR